MAREQLIIHPDPPKLKALQESAKNKPLYNQTPEADIIERFAAPQSPGSMSLNIVAPEFTSLCPLTGQPDFATIVLDYGPRDWCLESKSWKLYLGSFRNFGSFHEAIVALMGKHLIEKLEPNWLTLRGQFTPRGGIPFVPTLHYQRP